METAITLVQGNRISTITKSINNHLAIVLSKAYLASGQIMPEFEFSMIVSILETDIQRNFKQLTLDEVEHAINMGIRGELTERTDINNANLYQWMKLWKNSQDRMAAIKKARENDTKALPAKGEGVISEKEKWNSSVNHVLRAFASYKSCGTFNDYGNVAYLFLERIGLINYTPEKKREIYNTAKAILMKQQQVAALKATSASLINTAKRIFDELNSTDRHSDVIAEARRQALKVYFDNLIEMDEDLEQLLNENSFCTAKHIEKEQDNA